MVHKNLNVAAKKSPKNIDVTDEIIMICFQEYLIILGAMLMICPITTMKNMNCKREYAATFSPLISRQRANVASRKTNEIIKTAYKRISIA